MTVKGINRVRRNIRAIVKDIEVRRTEEAISAILTAGAGKAKTMTPISTGTLLNSQYAPQVEHSDGKAVGRIGYTAAYAVAVHNAPGVLDGLPRRTGSGNYWDPNAEPEFLAKGFEEIKPQIPAILAEIYKV